jgi:hypothetical protein
VVATDLPRTAELLAGGGGVTVPVGADGEASAVGEAAAAVLRGWEADPAALDAVVASGEGTREQLRAGAEGSDAWAAAIAVLARRRRGVTPSLFRGQQRRRSWQYLGHGGQRRR